MSTGIETWKNLSEIGPIYPFVGAEFVLVVVAVVFWLVWHVVQIGHEKSHHDESKSLFNKLKQNK